MANYDNYVMEKIEDLMRQDQTWKAEYLLQVYCNGDVVTDVTGMEIPKWRELLDRWANA